MLIALDQGRLSPEGMRRAHAHLDRCDLCRSAQAGLQRYTELANAARELDVPRVNYDTMALALRQEARSQAKAAGRRTLVSALAVAAVLALSVFGVSRLAPPAPTADNAATVPPVADATNTTALPATVTQRGKPAGAAHANSPTLTEGAVLQALTEELRVELWEGTEARLQRDTVARVEKLQGHQVRLRIERGAITSQVAPLTADDAYEIAVNDLVVAVRGTRFTVERSADGQAQVTLTEGKVDVTRDNTSLAHLVAPAQWSQAPGSAPIATELRARAANAQLHEGSITERPESRPGRSREPAAPPTRAVAVPTALKHLFARATPLLRACHQQSLRLDPTTPSAVSLVLTIDAAGEVKAVDVRAPTTVPEALASCIRGRVIGWHIPIPPQGGLVLDVPLSFATAP